MLYNVRNFEEILSLRKYETKDVRMSAEVSRKPLCRPK